MEKTFRIILLNFLIIFLLPKNVFAISGPNLLNPSNESTVSSSRLEWQAPSYALYSSNPYRVQVDDNSDFSSTYRDYYTSNAYYSPVLPNSLWFWRVKVKDSSGTWSDWSNIRSFTLSTTSPSPTETQTEEPYSTPYSTPAPLDSTPTPTTSTKSGFTISDIPTTIDSDKSFTVFIELSLTNSPLSSFYLKGAFKKSDSSNYFGLTKVGSAWVKNGTSYSNQYQITTNSSGMWSGTLEVKPDDSDSGFTGTSDYIFKVGRYTSSGSGPTWSNEETITINKVSSEAEFTEASDYENPYKPQGSTVSSPKSIVKNPPVKGNQGKVAGITLESTPSSQSSNPKDLGTEIKQEKKINFIPFIGAFMILLGLISIIYIFARQKLQSKL